MLPINRSNVKAALKFRSPLNALNAVRNFMKIRDLGLIPGLGIEKEKEEEMATHSSIFAWKIPWIEEPGRLQPVGLQRVGHY